MEDRLIVNRERTERRREQKELAANACYSVLTVSAALILLRPLMMSQILSRAGAYAALGQIEESRRQCDKALLLDSESSRAWYELAQIHQTTGAREMALEACRRATQADPMNRPAQFDLGTMYVEDGRYELAVSCFERVRAAGPEVIGDRQHGAVSYHRDALDMLALCYEKIGNPTRMEFTLEELRIFYPGHGDADERLARLKGGQARPE